MPLFVWSLSTVLWLISNITFIRKIFEAIFTFNSTKFSRSPRHCQTFLPEWKSIPMLAVSEEIVVTLPKDLSNRAYNGKLPFITPFVPSERKICRRFQPICEQLGLCLWLELNEFSQGTARGCHVLLFWNVNGPNISFIYEAKWPDTEEPR